MIIWEIKVRVQTIDLLRVDFLLLTSQNVFVNFNLNTGFSSPSAPIVHEVSRFQKYHTVMHTEMRTMMLKNMDVVLTAALPVVAYNKITERKKVNRDHMKNANGSDHKMAIGRCP